MHVAKSETDFQSKDFTQNGEFVTKYDFLHTFFFLKLTKLLCIHI